MAQLGQHVKINDPETGWFCGKVGTIIASYLHPTTQEVVHKILLDAGGVIAVSDEQTTPV